MADHAYTHRYVIFGRLVDAEAEPIAGITISMAATPGFRIEGPCSNQPGTETDAFGPTRTSAVTNAMGEFMICVHVHTLARDSIEEISLSATGTDAQTVISVDPELRQNFVLLESAGTNGAPAPERSHTIIGRAWRANATPIVIDSIRVFGDTVRQAPVVVSLPGLDPIDTTTNNYGDFAVRVPLAENAAIPTGMVEVNVNGSLFRAPIDGRAGVTYVPARFPSLDDIAPEQVTPPATTTPGAPAASPTATATATSGGSEDRDSPVPWIALAVVAGAVGVVLRRR